MNKKDIILLLDESESMSVIYDITLQSVNTFIEEQKSISNDEDTFSMWTFNTKPSKIIDNLLFSQVGLITKYKPNGMTSLYDAIGLAIKEKNKHTIIDNVVFVIITDGIDNASILFNIKMINTLINEMKDKHNWKFIYLGANHDAFAKGDSLGIKKSMCSEFECNQIEIPKIIKSTSDIIRDFRTSKIYDLEFKEENKPTKKTP